MHKCILVIIVLFLVFGCEDEAQTNPLDKYEMISINMTVADLLYKRYYLFESIDDIIYILDQECENELARFQENASGGVDTLYYEHGLQQETVLDSNKSDILYLIDKTDEVFYGQDPNEEIEIIVPRGSFFQLIASSWHMYTEVYIAIYDINGEYLSSESEITCNYDYWKPGEVELVIINQ
ncbi:MAG: hypothetical protein HQ528_04100 [Candidatus Marinimicrobia bacterium]|nr:hypothetical protein [Candidatus Neomarinimicrobiota bacterium]